MKRTVCLALVGMLCTSCIVQPVAYDPVVEETLVAAAVSATLAAAVAVEPSPTAPPLPTSTPMPRTPTPVPSPTAEVSFLPDDWTHYRSKTSILTFWYPTSWKIQSTEPGGVSFAAINAHFAITLVWDNLCDTRDAAEVKAALDCLADSLLLAFGASVSDVQLLRKEERLFGDRSGYVLEFELVEQRYRGRAHLVAVPVAPDLLVAVMGIAVDEQDLEYLDLVALSADLTETPEYEWLKGDPDSSSGAGRATGDYGKTEWSWDLSASGAYLVVEGRIANMGARPIMDVQMLIAAYDGGYRLLRADTCYADLPYLAPGRRSTFRLITPNPGGVEHVVIVALEAQWAE